MFDDGSITLRLKLIGQSFHSLVELSGVLRNTILHLGLCVEGANNVELLGFDDTGTTLFLHKHESTFLR